MGCDVIGELQRDKAAAVMKGQLAVMKPARSGGCDGAERWRLLIAVQGRTGEEACW
jgi:hypothetical protein